MIRIFASKIRDFCVKDLSHSLAIPCYVLQSLPRLKAPTVGKCTYFELQTYQTSFKQNLPQ